MTRCNLYAVLYVVLAFVCLTAALPICNYVYATPDLQVNSIPKPVLSDSSLDVEMAFLGLEFPTNMIFLDSEDVLVTEKNRGTVNRILNWTILPEPLLQANVSGSVESGMLGIALSKQSEANSNRPTYVYIYLTESVIQHGDNVSLNRLYRYELHRNKLINPQLLIELPSSQHFIHNGGDIAIGPDNNIYTVVGDLNKPKESLTSNFGNGTIDGTGGILRVTPEGKSVGTEIIGTNSTLSLYYAYGIRNSFGLAFDPLSGNLWGTENGGGLYDEINLIEPGFNGGWAQVEGPISLTEKNKNNSDKLVDFEGRGKYSDPQFTWLSTVAPTGIVFFDSNRLGSRYKNDMFVGDFKNGNIYHFKLNGNRSGLSLEGSLKDSVADKPEEYEEIVFGKDFGNITDIAVGPDGYLYVLATFLDNDLNDWTKCGVSSSSSKSCHGVIYRIT
jgi:aldose sugar dehydrogenase